MSVDPSQLDPSKFRKGYGVQQDEEKTQEELRTAQIRKNGHADPDPRYMASAETIRAPVTQPQDGALPTTEAGGSKEPTGESLDAAAEGAGFQVPTDESLDAALDAAFDKNLPYLDDDPILGALDWEDPSDLRGGAGGVSRASINPARLDPAGFRSHKANPYQGPVDDDYGLGIGAAFARGIIRLGSFIDIAQGDVEEYAEGQRAIQKYEMSAEDQAAMAEYQETDGFWDAVGYLVKNPKLLVQTVVESLPLSAAPLIGGAVGTIAGGATPLGPVGAIAGGATGAGLGSYMTEYMASISEALAEHGVDGTDANQLRAAFADEAFMATARSFASDRAIGVAAFDMLSMGIAGRIYRPIAGLKKAADGTVIAGKAASKTRAVAGGLSEVLAQGTGGGLGEAAAQLKSEGEITSKPDIVLEGFAEILPGFFEMAINKARGKDPVGKKPGDDDDDVDDGGIDGSVFKDDGVNVDATVEDDVADGPGPNELPPVDFDEDADVDEEGKPYIVPEAIEKEDLVVLEDIEAQTPSAPEPETATTPEETIAEAPDAPAAEVSGEIVIDDPTEVEVPPQDSLITKKDLKPKIDKQLKGTAEEQRPVRTAWRELTEALRKMYSDVDLPSTGSRTSGEGFGKFFQQLNEKVDISEDLPELKEYLEAVTTGKPAEIIKSLERLTYAVKAGIPSTTIGAGGPLLTQLRAVVNVFNEAIENRKPGKRGGGKHRNIIVWANTVGEMAAGIKAVVDDAADTGALEGLPSNFNDIIKLALDYADRAQSPREARTPSGGKTIKVDKVNRTGLKKLSDQLVIIADQLAEAVASREARVSFVELEQSLIELEALMTDKSPGGTAAVKTSQAKSGGSKGRVEPTLSGTAPVTSSKKDKQGRIEPTIKMERPDVHKRNPLGVEELSEPEVAPTPNEHQKKVDKRVKKRAANNVETLEESRKVVGEEEPTKTTPLPNVKERIASAFKRIGKEGQATRDQIDALDLDIHEYGNPSHLRIKFLALKKNTQLTANASDKPTPRSSSDADIEARNREVEEAASDVGGKTQGAKTVSLSTAAEKAPAANAPRTVTERESDERIAMAAELADTNHDTLMVKSMAELRTIAKTVGAKTARSKAALIANIFKAARVTNKLVADSAAGKAQQDAAKAKREGRKGMGMKDMLTTTEEKKTAKAERTKAAEKRVLQKKVKRAKGAEKAAKASKTRKNDMNRARVPKQYHGKKYLFHAVANEDDVQSIVDNGLDIGSNVSRIDGQALEGEGDTILVFEDTSSTKDKGYQADEVVTEMGMRPVAILKDTSLETQESADADSTGAEYAALNQRIDELAELYETTVVDLGNAVAGADLRTNKELKEDGWTDDQIKTIRKLNAEQSRIFTALERYDDGGSGTEAITAQDVMGKFRDTGLPVFDTTGEKLEKTVPGAKPDEVFDPQGKAIVGKRGGGSDTKGSLLEEHGVEGYTGKGGFGKALTDLGVTKAAADKLAVVYRSVSPAVGKKIVKVVNAFLKHKNIMQLTLDVEKAVGARPSGDVISAITQFATAIRDIEENTEINTVRDDAIQAYAEENEISLSDAESFLEDMGLIENQDPNRNWAQLEPGDRDTTVAGLQKYIAGLQIIIGKIRARALERLAENHDHGAFQDSEKLTIKIKQVLDIAEEELSNSTHALGKGKTETAEALREQAEWRLNRINERVIALKAARNADVREQKMRGDSTTVAGETATSRNTTRADKLLLGQAMDKASEFFNRLVRPSINGLSDVFAAYYKNKNVIIPNVTMQDVLDELAKVIPKNHRYAILIKRLQELKLDIPMKFYEDLYDVDPAGTSAGLFTQGTETVDDTIIYNKFNASIKILNGMAGTMTGARFVKIMMHEMVHAATVHQYETNELFQTHVNELWRQALRAFEREHMGSKGFTPEQRDIIAKGGPEATQELRKILKGMEGGMGDFYGLINPKELIAEAFTNSNFQRFLASIEVEETIPLQRLGLAKNNKGFKSLMSAFVIAIKRTFSYSVRNSLLDEVIMMTDQYMTSQYAMDSIIEKTRQGKLEIGTTVLEENFATNEEETEGTDSDVVPMSTKTNDIVDKNMRESGGIGGMYKTMKEKIIKGGRALNLGFMNRDAIERNYRDLYSKAAAKINMSIHPLTQYLKAKQAASVIAKKYEGKAYKILMRAQRLSNTARAKMFGLMRDTTLAQVWPDKPLNHPDNAHLWSKPNKKTGRTYLLPKIADMAIAARKKFVELQKSDPKAAKIMMEMAALSKEIQKAKLDTALEALGASFELTGKQVKALQGATTTEEIEAVLPILDEEAMEALRPVKGDSDVKKAEKAEALAKAKENKWVAGAAKKILKGTSIRGPYFPLRRYGDYVVTTTSEDTDEPLVVFVSTRWKADKLSKDLNDSGRKTYVSTKIKSQAVSADLESVATEISKRLTGPDAKQMRARLQTALIESLAENTAYASQLRRENVDGVAADDMGRAFEEYVHVSKYTIGDMSTAHDVQESLRNLKQLQNAEELTPDERNVIGAVNEEIRNQNKEDANDRDISTAQKVVGAIGFFNFLGAPSYWLLNATQTYTVTLPYLTAKYGANAPVALTKAQATVLAAVGRALASNDKSYEGFVAQLPKAAQLIVKRLEEENVIQSTIAHEFGDILDPGTMTRLIKSAGVIGRPAAIGAKMMEKVPEAVEHFNRISTALAAYSLSGDIVATVDAVQATQFNYDSANRARLLKALPLGAGGGARAVVTPIMMFKTYGIGVSRLLYGSMFDVVMKEEGKAEAAKLAGGLIVSHTIFGGVAGGLMLAPLSFLLEVFNRAFTEAGSEWDPEEAVEAFLQDLGHDAAAVFARRGLTAALLGIDLSKSINLGNLLWMGNDRYDFAESGGVEQSLAGLLGPVAQYGITSVREGYRLVSGDNRGNWEDFAAAVIPLKLSRGIIKGAKYSSEGLHTDSDLQFLDADEISGWSQLAMGMGFRSTEVGSSMDAYYGEMARQRRRDKRKSQLIERLLRATSAAEYSRIWKDAVSFNRSLDRRKDWINRGDVVRLKSQRRSRQRGYDREHRR